MKDNKLQLTLGTLPSLLLWRLLLVMLIYTLSRIVFYIYNTDLLGFTSLEATVYALWGGLHFDLSAVLYLNLLVIVLHLLPLPFRYHPRYLKAIDISYWTCNIPAFVLNLGDTVYYRFTGKRTTLDVFTEFANENALSFVHFFASYWVISFTGILLITLWVYVYRRLLRPNPEALVRGWKYYVGSLALLCLVAILVVGGLRGGFSVTTRPIAPNHAALYIDKPEQRAMVLNTPFTMIRLAGKQLLPEYRFMPEEEAARLYTAYYQEVPRSPWTGHFAGRNVVVIIWESLSREWIGGLNRELPGYQGFTPFVDSLLSKSWVFERAFANGGKSIDGMPAIFASIIRPGIPFVSSAYSGNALRALPTILKERGYDTRFYHNAPNGSMGFDAMARQLGFASYRGKTEFNNDDEFDGYWGIWDEPFLQYIANDLSTLKEPFFASEFTTTSHAPFNIPAKYHQRFPEGQHPQHRCMRYTDYALEQFFRTAQSQAWYHNTVFLITADHSIPGALEEYKNAYRSNAIPIIIFDPRGKFVGKDSTKPVQQADIFPTLLDLLGIYEPIVSYGSNMLATDPQRHFVVTPLDGGYQMIQGDYLLQFDGERVLALYNVAQDPGCKTDIQKQEPKVVASMLPTFKAYLQDFSRRMRENKLLP